MQFSTLCIHGGYRPDWTGSVTAPLYTSATYAHPGVGRSTGYDYARVQNPTREQLEKIIGTLEDGQEALVRRHHPLTLVDNNFLTPYPTKSKADPETYLKVNFRVLCLSFLFFPKHPVPA